MDARKLVIAGDLAEWVDAMERGSRETTSERLARQLTEEIRQQVERQKRAGEPRRPR